MRIKKTFVCRQVSDYVIDDSLNQTYQPIAGDVAIFEILEIGKHSHVQGENIRNTLIMPGDYLMAAFGTRYATAQFEGYIPQTPQQTYHILGAGGTIGQVHSTHARFVKAGPTTLRLVGYAVNRLGKVINTRSLCAHKTVPFSPEAIQNTRVILSLGSSMDSGKTTTAAYLVHGLKRSGYKVAFIKLTGTIYTKDKDLAFDMGADLVTDFGEMGYPSTYMCSSEELLNLYSSLMAQVMPIRPDFVIMEIADGIFQRETAMLLGEQSFMNTISGVVFSCADSLSAIQGLRSLEESGIRPLALSGLFTASPLLIEEVQERCHLPVFTIEELAAGAMVPLLSHEVKPKTRALLVA